MKVTCPRKDLLKGVNLLSAVVPTRTPKEILSCLKMTANANGTVTLVAFDTEIGLRYEFAGNDVRRPGESVVPLNKLSDILKNSDDDSVDLDASAEKIKVRAGQSKYELPGRPVDDYPDVPMFDNEGSYHEVNAADLLTMIAQTSFAVDKREAGGKFALKATCWNVDGDKFRLVATDTRRLAFTESPCVVHGNDLNPKDNFLIPPKTVQILQRSLADEEGKVKVSLRANDAIWKTPTVSLYSTLASGRFAPFKEIISGSTRDLTISIDLPIGQLHKKLRAASITTDDVEKKVSLSFGGGKIILEAHGGDVGNSTVTMDFPEYDGSDKKLIIDPSYLIEFLRCLDDGETVNLKMTPENKPVLFTYGKGYEYLLMPMEQ